MCILAIRRCASHTHNSLHGGHHLTGRPQSLCMNCILFHYITLSFSIHILFQKYFTFHLISAEHLNILSNSIQKQQRYIMAFIFIYYILSTLLHFIAEMKKYVEFDVNIENKIITSKSSKTFSAYIYCKQSRITIKTSRQLSRTLGIGTTIKVRILEP